MVFSLFILKAEVISVSLMELPVIFSAPGKVILHGEHAVVYGKVSALILVWFCSAPGDDFIDNELKGQHILEHILDF